jgi:HTH-type transcriptional regulator/antitoxin HigA
MAAEPMTWRRDWAVAPGEILLEAIQDRGMSQSDLARRMGRPIKTVNEIVNGKTAITPDTAIQLELTLGIEAAFWNNLESAYRAHLARQRSEAELAEHATWASAFPIKDLVKYGLIASGATKGGKVAAVLGYFGVSNPEAWMTQWSADATAYRCSPAFASSPYASAAWLRWGEILASEADTASFDAQRFREVLTNIRDMTRRDFPMIRDRVQGLCATAGVVLVVTPEFSGTHLSGAARWLTTDKAVIQLSLRHKTDDQFWFSFFHEARHLLGRKRANYLDANEPGVPPETNSDDDDEEEADRFSRDILIPPDAYGAFVAAGSFAEQAVRNFAKQQNIAPGIVVGSLQRDGHLDRSHLNTLKKPIRFA